MMMMNCNYKKLLLKNKFNLILIAHRTNSSPFLPLCALQFLSHTPNDFRLIFISPTSLLIFSFHPLSHKNMHTHSHTHTYMHTHLRAHTHTHTHTHTYTCTHARTHTSTLAHIHTHTHAQLIARCMQSHIRRISTFWLNNIDVIPQGVQIKVHKKGSVFMSSRRRAICPNSSIGNRLGKNWRKISLVFGSFRMK